MYLLDTNICIYAMKNRYPALSERLMTIPPAEICVSTVTYGEMEYGAAKSQWSERTRESMLLFLGSFAAVPYTVEDAAYFGIIRAILEKEGKPIGPYDLMIAAQGLARNYTVVTHNVGEFSRVPNLRVEDWTC